MESISQESVRLGHVVLLVASVEAAQTFYELAFGFSLLRQQSGYCELDAGGRVLACVEADVLEQAMGSGEGLHPPVQGLLLSLEVDSVDVLFQQAIEAGATALAEPRLMPWAKVSAFIKDPYGVLWEITGPCLEE